MTIGGIEVRSSPNSSDFYVGMISTVMVDADVPPTILRQPGREDEMAGASAYFEVLATGPDLRYRWLRDGSPIPVETNSSLYLNPINRSDQATFSVEVWNQFGTNLSALAPLRVRAPVHIGQISRSGQTIQLRFGDPDGHLFSAEGLSFFRLSASSNLTDWVTLPLGASRDGGAGIFTQSDSGPWKFYRIEEN